MVHWDGVMGPYNHRDGSLIEKSENHPLTL